MLETESLSTSPYPPSLPHPQNSHGKMHLEFKTEEWSVNSWIIEYSISAFLYGLGQLKYCKNTFK